MYEYDETFYEYLEDGALLSASKILPFILSKLSLNSVIDFGCGRGAWLHQWKKQGVRTVHGFDGPYVDAASLLIDEKEFSGVDLTQAVDLKQTFDMAYSLEVAEHIPTIASEQFVKNICQHSKMVMFSAAVPGQGGENHINEQTLSFWHALFAAQDYELFDWIRAEFKTDSDVEPWYKYNTVFYAHKSVIKELPDDIKASHVPLGQEPKDISPFVFRLRKAVLRHLSSQQIDKLAVLKHKFLLLTKKPSSVRS